MMYLCANIIKTMATNKTYQLHLKGFVGGYDFDADYVDYILSKNSDKEVNVLIDSLGGKSNTALSIFSAFKRHGNVNVHFVGMNASAATIASLGAKRISIDQSAMYLVHKCSIAFFEWGHLNADDLQQLIANIEQQKKDLDKLDANIAQMYATRCKKNSAELLELMKTGGWLTAQEALAWGFVDELTEYEEENAPKMTETLAAAMASAGIPIPNIPNETPETSAMTKFLNTLTSFFKSNKEHIETINPPKNMKKIFKNICAILSCDDLEVNEGSIQLKDEQADAIETAINADKESIKSLTDEKNTLAAENATLKAEIEELKKKPADTTAQVVNDKHEKNEPDALADFLDTTKEAKSLYDLIP